MTIYNINPGFLQGSDGETIILEYEEEE